MADILFEFNEICNFLTTFRRSHLKTKFKENPSSGSCSDTREQTDGHDEANRSFAVLMRKAPK